MSVVKNAEKAIKELQDQILKEFEGRSYSEIQAISGLDRQQINRIKKGQFPKAESLILALKKIEKKSQNK